MTNKKLLDFSRWCLDQLVPPCCLLCGINYRGELTLICDDCLSELPYNHHSCRHCALPLDSGGEPSNGLACARCLRQPPPFSQVLAPLNYSYPIDHLISGFKYRNKLISGRLLSQLLLRDVLRHYRRQTLPDLLLPVPLHWRRQLRRGYNQSICVASYLSRQLEIPLQLKRLSRPRRTATQQGLKYRQRQLNLKDAFSVDTPLEGESIALIDDVVTTAATATEISRTLLAAGAGEVHIWALARTPSPQR